MKNNLYKRIFLVFFVALFIVGFIFSPELTSRAKAMMISPTSYINSFSISALSISYNQEKDGYVCLEANEYDPIEQSFSIYAGPLELAGAKSINWQGKDNNGNVLPSGSYIFEASIHYQPGCTWPATSFFAEKKPYEIVVPPQSWSFAIISDLHVGQGDFDFDYGDKTWNDGASGDNNVFSVKNLEQTIQTINSNVQKYNLKFVAVTGDFSDSAELSELNKAKDMLDTLNLPWIPIIGNHDVWPYYGSNPNLINRLSFMAPEVTNGNGTDKYFYDIFAEQYQKLANIFPDWQKEPMPVWNSFVDPGRNSYLENFSFDFNGYHFIGLDFDSRGIELWPADGAAAEGNLNAFSGGTWLWFMDNLHAYKASHPNESEKIILLAHHPFRKEYYKSFYDLKLYNIGFSDDELKTIGDSLIPYSDEIYALFAGHTHKTYDDSIFGDALKLVETPANVDNPVARIVQIYPDGRIDYSKMLGNDMTITAHSPIDLEVTDPDGLVINKSASGISGASYYEEDINGDGETEDQIQIPERKQGDYKIRVIPQAGAAPSATYSLDVSTLEDNFGYTPIVLAQNVPLSQAPQQPYNFEAKRRIATNLSYGGDVSGLYSDTINLSASLTGVSGNPVVGKNIAFNIGDQTISAATNASGVASASLVLAQIPGNYYSVQASFAGDEDYLPSQAQADFSIKSAKQLKQEALAGLAGVQISDKKANSEIQAAKKSLQESLDNNLWLDDSHVIFFSKECVGKNQSEIDPDKIDPEDMLDNGKAEGISAKCFRPRSGLVVFADERDAVNHLQNVVSGKLKIPSDLKDVLNGVIIKLVKADATLAGVAIYDAENLSVENTKIQKKIEKQTDKAKAQMTKALEFLSKDKPEKAIARFSMAWLHAQLAARLAN